jgi:Demethylmenaquinone methyltransferase
MATLTERLGALDTCVLSDALDALGVTGVAEGLSRLATTRKVAGRVMTVKLEEARGRTAPRHLCTAAVDAARPGDVIVVEHHSRADCAGWGGILSKAAALKGLSGTIIDGMARDIDEAELFGYPVFGKGGIPRTARGRIIETEYATPINVDGITVTPGDYVLADGTGVVFVPAARAEEIVAKAESLQAREAAMIAALERGLKVSEVMAGNYERMLES